jgi:hypothetical protein
MLPDASPFLMVSPGYIVGNGDALEAISTSPPGHFKSSIAASTA